MFKWLATLIVIVVVSTGCGNAARNESPSPQSNGDLRSQSYSMSKKEIQDPGKVAQHLEQLAEGVDGVEKAHCVIVGNTAIVGVDVRGDLERSRVGTIKYSVAEAFRKDPYGVDALVTADVDIANRLNEIGEDIRSGRPVAGFAEELADIIGRLIPQLPRDVLPPDEDLADHDESMNPNADMTDRK